MARTVSQQWYLNAVQCQRMSEAVGIRSARRNRSTLIAEQVYSFGVWLNSCGVVQRFVGRRPLGGVRRHHS